MASRRGRGRKKLPVPNIRTELTPEEIQRAASKEWKFPTIFTTDETLFKRMRNLRGPKTFEGKIRALQNLRPVRGKYKLRSPGRPPKHGGYMFKILDAQEQEFYEERRRKYIQDYDLNESADEAILRMVLMDEVIYFRLLKRKYEKPSLNIDRPLGECQRRLIKSLEALGATRAQRQGLKINIQASIADLVANIEQKVSESKQRRKQMQKEIEQHEKNRVLPDVDGGAASWQQVHEIVKKVQQSYFGDSESNTQSDDSDRVVMDDSDNDNREV